MDLRIKGIDHVVLRTPDIDRALAFYVGVLGCRLSMRFPKVGLHQLRIGASIIDIFDCAQNPPSPDENQRVHHFALQLESFDGDALLAYLDSHGVRHDGVRTLWGSNGRGPSIHFYDPDGNMLEFKGPASTHVFGDDGKPVELEGSNFDRASQNWVLP